jgi:hypothetical protein
VLLLTILLFRKLRVVVLVLDVRELIGSLLLSLASSVLFCLVM